MKNFDPHKKYAVLGLGLSGLAALDFLIAKKVQNITVHDTNFYAGLSEAAKNKLEEYKPFIQCELGTANTTNLLKADVLVVSPGVKPENPLVQAAYAQGLEVVTEIDLAASFVKNLIGVTGTNGKSTTTAWIGHVLGAPVCGNIGKPFTSALQEASPDAWYVCELSSFQLTYSQALKPKIALITNITPDHLDWHGNFENYLAAKSRISSHQDETDWLLLPNTEPLKNLQSRATKFWIETQMRSESSFQNAVWAEPGGDIIFKKDGLAEKVFNISQIALAGWHNVQNALFAYAAARLAEPNASNLISELLSFKGLAHRLEYVAEVKGKKFYNDSKATNPESTMMALNSFVEPVTWLAGGRDKLTSLNALNELASQKAEVAIFYGEAAGRFAQEIKPSANLKEVHLVEDLKAALSLAQRKDPKIVLLSPACASFDQFKNFEERGDFFKKLVGSLAKEH